MRNSTSSRAFIAVLASAAFLWTLALSASPQLHQRIHRDANKTDHVCAITLISSGNYHHSPSVPLVSVPVPREQLSSIPALTPQWVEPLFLLARIFEHAPPAQV